MEAREKKFTPGKWFQSHRQTPYILNGNYSTQVYTEDGETIATLHWYPKPPQFGERDGEPIKIIGTYRDANARLIAQAPDMYDLLCSAVEFVPDEMKQKIKTVLDLIDEVKE